MPLNPAAEGPGVWIQHLVEEGACTRCGAVIPTMHRGPIWVRQSGMRATCEPMGQWKECTV